MVFADIMLSTTYLKLHICKHFYLGLLWLYHASPNHGSLLDLDSICVHDFGLKRKEGAVIVDKIIFNSPGKHTQHKW